MRNNLSYPGFNPVEFDGVGMRVGLMTITHRTPQDIMDEIAALDAESAEVLAGIRGLL